MCVGGQAVPFLTKQRPWSTRSSKICAQYTIESQVDLSEVFAYHRADV